MSDQGSVFQKGGGGTNFEQSVQSAFLTTLAIRGNAPCLTANEIIEVSFQNTKHGYQTDDLLIVAQSSLGKHRLLLQIKHDISFTKGSTIFKEVIAAFWADFNNTAIFDRSKDKLIVVKNGLTKDERNHLRALFNWAVTHATEADFIREVARIEGKARRLNVFRDCLQEANDNVALTDKELWEFLRCVDVLEYDFLNQSSVDESYIFNLIRLSKRKDTAQNEKEIWNDILGFASRLNKDGGNATTNSIRQEDFYKNFAAENLHPYFKSVSKLRSDSTAILKPIKNTIGDLHLNRLETKESIVRSLFANQFTIITGKPGVGKSAEIKDVLNDDFPTSSVFVFRADQFNQPHIANVFSSQGINETIQDVFSCISLIPNKVLFIDSLEKLLEADPESAFNQLVSVIKDFPDIRVIGSCRKYAIDLIIQKFELANHQLEVVEVPILTDEELAIVSAKFPQIKSITRNQQLRKFLVVPKYLDFALRALNKSSDDFSNISQTDYKAKLWDALVVDTSNIRNGLPIKREKAFMEIAVNRAKEMKLFAKPIHADAEAIVMLEQDEILFQDHLNRRYAPTHDILEDWALERYISSIFEDHHTPKELFTAIGNEPAIRRAFRLWIESLLNDESEEVNVLIKATLQDDSIEKYWSDELLVAVFRSDSSDLFFKLFEKELLENNSQFMQRCMDIITTCCKESDVSGMANSILLPVGSGWKETLLFIKNHLSVLDILRPAIINFITDWHYRLILQYENTDEAELEAAKEIVVRFINQIETNKELLEDDSIAKGINSLVPILFDLAPIAKNEIRQLVERAAKANREDYTWRQKNLNETIIEKCIAGLGNQRLAKELPEIVIQTAWEEWKLQPRQEPRSDSITSWISDKRLGPEELWGITGKSSFFPSGIYKTPFYNVLQYHPLLGLKFITEFLNYSVEFCLMVDSDYKPNLKAINIELNDGTLTPQWGAQELWTAYRGMSVTHNAIESLLMSLEKYLLETASRKTEVSKKDLKFIFIYLLQNSNNIFTTGVLASIVMAYPEEVEEAMLPILKVREFYEWDLHRALDESSVLSPTDNKISFAQEERHKSNQLPHRRRYRRGLRDFILEYQFNIRKINKEVHQVFDILKANTPQEDIIWRKALTEMDARNHSLGDYDEKTGGYIIQPEYEKDVTDFIEANEDKMLAERKALNTSSILGNTYERKETIEFPTWESYFREYSGKNNFDILFDRPVTLAALGLRDFNSNLNDEQREWCANIILNIVTTHLEDVVNGNYGFPKFNPMDKEVAMTSLHLLFHTNKEDKRTEFILMIIHLLTYLSDHEISKFLDYIKTKFFDHQPLVGKRVWLGLIKYAKLKKIYPSRHGDDNNEQATKKRENLLAKEVAQSGDESLALEAINFGKYEGYILARAFLITPFHSKDEEYSVFIHHFTLLLIEDLKIEDDTYQRRHHKTKQLDFQSISDSKGYLSDLFLKAERKLAIEVFDLLINSANEEKERLGKRRDNLYEFVSDTLKFIITKLDDIIASSSDESLNQKLITSFWDLWQHFFSRTKDRRNHLFIDILFLDIKWKKTAEHWRPLEGKENFYLQMVTEFGGTHIDSILNVLSTIGDKTLLPNGLNWIVEICKKNESLTIALAIPSANRLIRRLFYNHITVIKKNKQLINNYIWLLNKMVELGSSEAYLFRENVITYKSS
ncbi:AAA family ATPase [Cesiribacter sp. SM1]|uniref:AAA family ATPase n=1 Tax=Cesiribacter sp. SM1 TaxID=2861196 RepID=UPI001CD7ACE5|nr:AAA family ATPase [Cesiribacter sp. SM1]